MMSLPINNTCVWGGVLASRVVWAKHSETNVNYKWVFHG